MCQLRCGCIRDNTGGRNSLGRWKRMEASDFNGDIDEKDLGKDYDNH